MATTPRWSAARAWVVHAAGLAALLLVHGCAPVTTTPPMPAAAPPALPRAEPNAPGYGARVDDLGAVDTTALHGRRIVLDPGHGGMFPGAVGVNGLDEARVNLAVAIRLRDLLAARGADVIMTRTADRDFVTASDSSLRADLAERVRIANAATPDLFVSIHHNADAFGAHDINETQTYYKLGDDGLSLDAAQSVHRYLVRNLGIPGHRILPGNYFVLRGSEAPALLTESSYITNPDVESRLKLPDKQRLEAEALYLGIAHYFSRPRPVVQPLVAYVGRVATADTLFTARGPSRLEARVSGVFDFASIELDGVAIPVNRERGRVWAAVPPLPSGVHHATLRVRLSGVGSARDQRRSFRIDRPAATLRVTDVTPLPETGGVVAVRVETLDALRQPVTDSTAVRISVVAGKARPADTLVTARDGVAWGYFRVAAGATELTVHAALRSTPADDDHDANGRAPGRDDVATGFARAMPEDRLLTGAPETRERHASDGWINRDGFVLVPRAADGSVAIPQLRGYRTWTAKTAWPPRFTAIAGGALQRSRIVIDPEGGGDDDAGTGPSGTRACNLNLEVARALAELLRAAGAEVRSTRDGDVALSDVERTQIGEAFRPDRLVRIGHRAGAPLVAYWFGSVPGKRWALRTADRLEALGFGRPQVAEDMQYPLQQASCPALYVSATRIDDAADEDRLLGPGAVRAEAYAIYLALVGEWSDATIPIATIRVRDARGRPLPGALVLLGGATLVETGPDGVVRIGHTERGPMLVEVNRGRLAAKRVLLDSESKVTVVATEKP